MFVVILVVSVEVVVKTGLLVSRGKVELEALVELVFSVGVVSVCVEVINVGWVRRLVGKASAVGFSGIVLGLAAELPCMV